MPDVELVAHMTLRDFERELLANDLLSVAEMLTRELALTLRVSRESVYVTVGHQPRLPE